MKKFETTQSWIRLSYSMFVTLVTQIHKHYRLQSANWIRLNYGRERFTNVNFTSISYSFWCKLVIHCYNQMTPTIPPKRCQLWRDRPLRDYTIFEDIVNQKHMLKKVWTHVLIIRVFWTHRTVSVSVGLHQLVNTNTNDNYQRVMAFEFIQIIQSMHLLICQI